MDKHQGSAVETLRHQLCGALQESAEYFLTELEMHSLLSTPEAQSIQSGASNGTDKILRSLKILQRKDNGYAFLISHLRHNNMSSLADELDLAVQIAASSTPRLYLLHGTDRDIIKELKAHCIDFYSGNFRTVGGFDGDTEPIESVWISLQLEGEFTSSKNYEDIFIQMAQNNCRAAVVKGQPGSGKTTLIKKIAYDWAKLNQNNSKKTKFQNILTKLIRSTPAKKFDLILAAPLRNVQLGTDPLQMAVGFLLQARGSAVNLPDVERISGVLMLSRLKILVILDGLDEYEYQSNSLLNKMFGSALASNVSREATAPIHLKYDLLVTSRPYACKTVNKSLLTHKWEIAGFTQRSHLEFVQQRCKTEKGKQRAVEYLQNTSVLGEISSIPLLLLLVCFLSDQNVDVPAKLTNLYEIFILRMLIRSAEKGAIVTFDTGNWRKSDLIRILGGLALLGVFKNKFEFSRDEKEMCDVGDDSFDSGLLLFRSDPVSSAIKADFPHRSIQDFLAALYCVNFWPADSTISSATGWPERIWPLEGISEMKVEMLVAKMIPFGDSQFCRFYFGLLSGQPEFELKMRKALEKCADVFVISPHFLFCLSNFLADSSDAECFLTGEIVNSLVDRSFNWTKSHTTEDQVKKINISKWTEDKRIDVWPKSATTELRSQLQSGLKLKGLGNSLESFCLRSESQTELKLILIWLGEENLVEKLGELQRFEKYEWLWIESSGSAYSDKLKFAFEVVKLLPKCRNCLITDDSAESFIIRLWMERKSKFPVNSGRFVVNPEFIYFQVERSLGEEIFGKLSSLRKKDSGEVEFESWESPFPNDQSLRLAVSSTWSVWDFLRSEAEWSPL